MHFKIQIYPSAEKEFYDLVSTYGDNCEKCISSRIENIVKAESKGNPFPSASLLKLLKQIHENYIPDFMNKDAWLHTLSCLRSVGAMEKLKALLALIVYRKPPYEVKVVRVTCDDPFYFSMMIYYEVNRTDCVVNFLKFRNSFLQWRLREKNEKYYCR